MFIVATPAGLFGGGFVTVKKVTLPPRPFVGVNADDGREMLALTNNAIDLAARNRGGAA